MNITFGYEHDKAYPHCCACGAVIDPQGINAHGLWHNWDCDCRTENHPDHPVHECNSEKKVVWHGDS